MASILERGPNQYQVVIRRKYHRTQTKTFETKREAKAWANVIESEMARGVFTDRTEAEQTTLGEALERYKREITVDKRSPRAEEKRIAVWLRHSLAMRSLASLRGSDFAQYRDARLKAVGGNTIRLELAIISHLFTIARTEWDIAVDNPIRNVRMPKLPPPRSRRLEGEEEALLLTKCDASGDGVWLRVVVELAIETGMREGELATLEWGQIDFKKRTARLEMTKNGDGRTVPLSRRAVELLNSLPRSFKGRVFKVFGSADDLARAFGQARNAAGIEDLHFHDLRHEAASRLAPHMPVQTLAKVLGWKTLQMAMRYYNPSDDELVRAVDLASQNQGTLG
ncbi:MAG: site-specific integrase [Thiobacillus sp.]